VYKNLARCLLYDSLMADAEIGLRKRTKNRSQMELVPLVIKELTFTMKYEAMV